MNEKLLSRHHDDAQPHYERGVAMKQDSDEKSNRKKRGSKEDRITRE